MSGCERANGNTDKWLAVSGVLVASWMACVLRGCMYEFY